MQPNPFGHKDTVNPFGRTSPEIEDADMDEDPSPVKDNVAPLTRAAVQKLTPLERTWWEAEQCVKNAGSTPSNKQHAMLFMDLRTKFEQLTRDLDDVRSENVALRDELTAYRSASQASEASRPEADKVVGEIQIKIAQLQEQVQPLVLKQQEVVAAATTAAKATYASAAGKQATQQQGAVTSTFRLTPCKGSTQGLPDTKAGAIKTIQAVLAEMTDQGVTLRAADARVQSNDKHKPMAVVFSMLKADAHELKTLLWADGTRHNLELLGWRMGTHLPAVEYQSKQALWVKHGQQMRAWVDAGKCLIYCNSHTSVSVVGDKTALQL